MLAPTAPTLAHTEKAMLVSSSYAHALASTLALSDIRACGRQAHKHTHIAADPTYSGLLAAAGSMVAYVWGNSDSNECPGSFLRITTEEGCRAAAVAKGRLYDNQYTNTAARPSGCYTNSDGINVWLNVHPVGAGFHNRLLLCAGAPLAHLAMPMHAILRC
jgi:hypothetical protein